MRWTWWALLKLSAAANIAAALIFLGVFSPPCAAGSGVLLDAQIGGDAQRTRFVAFLSKKVDYRVFSILDPYRLVIDLPEVEIQVPGEKRRGLVLSSRAGLLAEGKSRIVIDLLEPALVEKAEILEPENGLPARLVIDLTRTTIKAFAAASKTAPEAVIPKQPGSKTAANNDSSDKRPLIVVDPGHGGVDAGAHGRTTNTPEKDVTFDFANALKEKLDQTGRYRVVMTRSIDVFVPLDERAELASSQNASLLISIHADALDPKALGVKGLQEVRGGTVYTLSEQASDDQAKALAQHENKADVQAGVASGNNAAVSAEIDSILSDLESRGKKNRSLAIAAYLIEHLKDKMKFNVRPHRSANLRVLKAAGVPAVLVELGYLSNDEDEKLLTSKEWRATTAGYMADAVNAFMTERQARLPL